MSSDSQPSIRGYWKGKIKKIIKPNITSSIREHIISNETYQNFHEKYHDLKDTFKNRTNFETIVNKSKGLLPGVFPSKDNQTYAKGFYDSLFSSQEEQDIYFKVAIICLWIIAILCIIPTIITLFIPDVRNRSNSLNSTNSRNSKNSTNSKKSKNSSGVKMVFFHILLCELFYLIYILLSMINVAQNFQLNSFLCDFANYGMYVTIPVMHFALFFLTLERLASFIPTNTCTTIFTKGYVIQIILIFIWIISIAISVTIIFVTGKFSLNFFKSKIKNIAPSFIGDIGKVIIPSYRCSIDGRLSSIFKILFIILFIILIILIIKSMVVSMFYGFIPNCFRRTNGKNRQCDYNMTLLFITFLLLNLFFSFPFYFVSMANSIVTSFTSKKDLFTMKLKICFILRISSIILQCLTFSTFENNSWRILSRLLFYSTCKKISALNNGNSHDENDVSKRKISENNVRTWHKGKNNTISDSETDEKLAYGTSNNETTDGELNNTPKDKSVNQNKSRKNTKTPVRDETDSDNGMEPVEKPKLPNKNKNITNNSRHKTDNIEEREELMERTSSKHNNTNGLSRQISNSKPTSQQISLPITTNLETVKSNSNANGTKRPSNQHSSSSDDTSSDNINSSDDESSHKTYSSIPKISSTNRSFSTDQKHAATVLPNSRHSHQQRHDIKHSKSYQPTTTTSNNHHHTRTTNRERSSLRNTNNHSEKSKKKRRPNIEDISSDV